MIKYFGSGPRERKYERFFKGLNGWPEFDFFQGIVVSNTMCFMLAFAGLRSLLFIEIKDR